MRQNGSPADGFPPYAFVPGGPWPHPTASPEGHAHGRPPRVADPVADGEEGWTASAEFLRGVALFNAGYYWEAHESWEALWHAHGRREPTADLLKALIKLAAAGVKVRQGQPSGVATHARRAAALIVSIREQVGPRLLGLDLDRLSVFAADIAERPPADPGVPGARVVRVFDVRIEPGGSHGRGRGGGE